MKKKKPSKRELMRREILAKLPYEFVPTTTVYVLCGATTANERANVHNTLLWLSIDNQIERKVQGVGPKNSWRQLPKQNETE